MKRFLILLLAILLLAVPVAAQNYLVRDGEALLTANETAELEELYGSYADTHGFTPVLVTTDSFGGRTAADFAGSFYDANQYPRDGILLLVSLSEGEWYILTNGACYDQILDAQAASIGEQLLPLIREGEYYDAFALFPELANETFSNSTVSIIGGADGPTSVYVRSGKNYGKTIGICMGVGLLIGLAAVGIMASKMRSVRMQSSASDYVRPGSMHLTSSRDIFLYSHVSRTPKPKNHTSGGHHGGGGGRGGAGGRI